MIWGYPYFRKRPYAPCMEHLPTFVWLSHLGSKCWRRNHTWSIGFYMIGPQKSATAFCSWNTVTCVPKYPFHGHSVYVSATIQSCVAKFQTRLSVQHLMWEDHRSTAMREWWRDAIRHEPWTPRMYSHVLKDVWDSGMVCVPNRLSIMHNHPMGRSLVQSVLGNVCLLTQRWEIQAAEIAHSYMLLSIDGGT